MCLLGALIHEVTASVFEAVAVEKTTQGKIKMVVDEQKQHDPRMKLPIRLIRKHHDVEISRQRTIEDKARVSLSGLTVAGSLLFAGLGFLSSQLSTIMTASALAIAKITLVVSASYLLAGGLAALKATEISTIYTVSLENQAELMGDAAGLAQLHLTCLDANTLANSIRNNYSHVSQKCMRNGLIVLLLLAVALVAVWIPRSQTDPGVPKPSDSLRVCSVLTGERRL